MWFVLRHFYPFLPVNGEVVSAEIFENKYLAKTGNLGAIYFNWLASFDEDFEPGMGVEYRKKQRKLFVDSLLTMDLGDLLFSLTKELDR